MLPRKKEFIKLVFEIAEKHGHRIEMKNGEKYQIAFVNSKGNIHKKLHLGHITQLFELGITSEGVDIYKVIENVAPKRPCTHKPFKEIIKTIKEM